MYTHTTNFTQDLLFPNNSIYDFCMYENTQGFFFGFSSGTLLQINRDRGLKGQRDRGPEGQRDRETGTEE